MAGEKKSFLIYVAHTYKWMTPYLEKRIHLKIGLWRTGRERKVWKVKQTKSRMDHVQIWEWDQEKWIDTWEEYMTVVVH